MKKSLIEFSVKQMNSKSKRLKTYLSWVVFKDLNVSKRKLIKTLNGHNIETQFVLGEFDRMIPLAAIQKFSKSLLHKEVTILKAGHSSILDHYYNLLKKNLTTDATSFKMLV